MQMEQTFYENEEVSGTEGLIMTNLTYRIESTDRSGLLSWNTGDTNDFGHNRLSLIDGTEFSKHESWTSSKWTLVGNKTSGYKILSTDRSGLISWNTGDTNDFGHNRISRIDGSEFSKHESWTSSYWVVKGNSASGYLIESIDKYGLLSNGTEDKNGYGHNRVSRIEGSHYEKHKGYTTSLWKFIPVDYELSAHLVDFDFGDFNTLKNILSSKKKLAFSAVEMLTVSHHNLGAKIGSTYGESILESFEWGLDQKLGIGVTTEVKCGIPFIAEGKLELSGNFEFGANQKWSTQRSKNFSTTIEMSPTEPGVYKLGKIVHVAENVSLPFKATAKLFAKSKQNDRNFSGKAVLALYKYEGIKAPVKRIGANFVEVQISGTLTASYGVWAENVAKKVQDL